MPPTWLNSIVQNLVNGLNILVGRRVQHDDHRPKKTDRTAKFAQRPQLLLEEVRAQDRTDENAERS